MDPRMDLEVSQYLLFRLDIVTNNKQHNILFAKDVLNNFGAITFLRYF